METLLGAESRSNVSTRLSAERNRQGSRAKRKTVRMAGL